MIIGRSKPKILILETGAGVALSYANKAAFQAAGWDLTWRDADGVALTSQPTWTIADEGGGRHRVKYTVPAGPYWVEPTILAGSVIEPETWANEGLTNDADTIGGLLQTNQGTPGVSSADDADLGDVVEGDDYNSGTLYIPLGKLQRWGVGFADLASGWTITAAFKAQPSDPPVTVTCAFGATVATDGAFALSWAVYPSGVFTLGATEESKLVYCDVQLKRASDSLLFTTNRYRLQIVWERNEAT